MRGHRVRGLVGILAMSTLLGLASIIGEGGLSDTTKEAIYKDSKGDKTEAIAEPSNNTSAGHQCTLQQTMPIVVSVPTVCQPTICSCIAAGKSKNKAGAAKTKIVEPSDSVNCK